MTLEAASPIQRPFTLGRTLGTSFAVFGRNLVPFLIVTTIISLPYIVIQTGVDYAAIHAPAEAAYKGSTFAMLFVQIITFGLVQAALTYGTVQDLRGERAGMGACFRLGLARSGHIVSGAIQYGLLLGLATLLLIIPGILLYMRWWVFMPAMVVENLSSKQSFQRSKDLTAGRRWTVFALTGLVFVVQIACMFGLMIGVGDSIDGILAGDIVVTLLAVLFTSFSSVVAAVGYYHLRVEKEGAIIDDIAKVFD